MRIIFGVQFVNIRVAQNILEKGDNISAALLYAESISAWSNQGSVMCFVHILNQ